MRVYIAGPNDFAAFVEAEYEVQEMGDDAVSPFIDGDAALDPQDSLRLLLTCSAIYVLRGYDAALELHIAKALGYDVVHQP